jgi:hypothetical protein
MIMKVSNNSYHHCSSSGALIIFSYAMSVLLYTPILCTIAFAPNSNHHRCFHNDFSVTRYCDTHEISILYKRNHNILYSSSYKHNDERNSDEDGLPRSDNNNSSSSSQHNEHRESEFKSIEPRTQSSKHQKRLEEEQIAQNTFVPYGNELWELRSTLLHLSKQLIRVMALNNDNTSTSNTMEDEDSKVTAIISENDIREMIREVEAKDPELVYALEKEKMTRAMEEDRIDEAEEHKRKALIAKRALPYFNLHGLWVGK